MISKISSVAISALLVLIILSSVASSFELARINYQNSQLELEVDRLTRLNKFIIKSSDTCMDETFELSESNAFLSDVNEFLYSRLDQSLMRLIEVEVSQRSLVNPKLVVKNHSTTEHKVPAR